jgi:hypothetical protein
LQSDPDDHDGVDEDARGAYGRDAMSAPRSELRTVLATQSPGKLPPAIGESVLELLRQCWHQVDGGGEEGMHAGKLERAEDLTWEPHRRSWRSRAGGTFGHGMISTWEDSLPPCTRLTNSIAARPSMRANKIEEANRCA